VNQPTGNDRTTTSIPPTAVSAHPTWDKIREVLLALSLGTLFFVSAWFPLLYGGDIGYFKQTVTRTSLLAMETNILWLAAIAWFLINARRRFGRRWLSLMFDCLVFTVFLLVIDFSRRTLLHIQGVKVLASLKRPPIAIITLVAISCAIWQARRLARAGALVAELLSPLAVFIVLQIPLAILGVAHLPEPNFTPPLQQVNSTHPRRPRVLWIIFDETDYRLAYEQRPAGVDLPEFDRLRAESVCATNAYPPADMTLISMPGLISGQPATNASPSGASELGLTLRDGRQELWSKLPSVFGSARELGFNTALVGWFHPYRRILHRDLNYCSWYPYPSSFPSQQPTFGSAMFGQIGCLAPGWEHSYANTCRAMIADSISIVTNDDFGLILLHLPPPHQPGVYLPEKDAFTVWPMPTVTGYFNNLALADRTLGKLRAAMTARGEWGKTWIILSADHSWRRSRLYDGKRDLRVPFLIKAPGESNPTVYSQRINTVLTHDLILGILRREIPTEADLLKWLDSHASQPATAPMPHESSSNPVLNSE
jgi:hypothetical protein